MSSNNWLELGLSPDEEKTVRRAAELYKAVYLDTIDNVFIIARALKILSDRHRNSGIQGGFADALVQYGFTARDGGPMNKAIRSHLKTLLENEQSVRAWWTKVPERTKRDWLSAKAIYTHWKTSQDPPRKPSPHVAATNAAPDHAAKTAQASAEPQIDPATLSMSAQQKFEAAIRIHKARLDKQFEQRVYEEVRRRIDTADNSVREQNKELSLKNFDLERIVGQRGVFTKAQFRQMQLLCHPDNSASEKTRAELTQLLIDNEKRLVKPSIDWGKVEAAITRYVKDRSSVTITNVWKAAAIDQPVLDPGRRMEREMSVAVGELIRRLLRRLGFTEESKSGGTFSRPT